MLHNLWNTFLYEPLVNTLALFVSIVPGGDLGLAVILLTVFVKLLLSPLSKKSIKSQKELALLTPELNKIKKSNKSKEEQAKETFELYKKHKVNPFSGCLVLLIQIPVVFALYSLFLKGVSFETTSLYYFIPKTEVINPIFIGLIDISQKSLILAVLAGITQFIQAHFMPKNNTSVGTEPGSFQESFAKSMQMQMKYVFPFIIAFISYSISGAIALYIIVSNVFATLQQIYLNKDFKD